MSKTTPPPSPIKKSRHKPSMSFDDNLTDSISISTKDYDAFLIQSLHKKSPSFTDQLRKFSLFGINSNKHGKITHAKQDLSQLFKDAEESRAEEKIEDWLLEDFEKMEILGDGSFGQVVKCQHIKTKKYYAMKIMKKRKLIDLKQVQHTMNEKELQMELGCPFIVKLFTTFQNEKNLYMIMEFVQGGELFTWLKRNVRFDFEVTKFLTSEILLAMEFIHNSNCVYRDLKPENILIDASGHIKIADFGFVKRVEKKTWSMIGTPNYLAPEVLLGSGHDKGVDFWSLGILIYEMLVGKSPFEGSSPQEVFRKINEGKLLLPGFINKNAKDLIRKLLTKERHDRLGCGERGIAEIKEHPFFEGTDWNKVANKQVESPLHIELDGDEGSSKYFRKETGRNFSRDDSLIESEKDLFKNF